MSPERAISSCGIYAALLPLPLRMRICSMCSLTWFQSFKEAEYQLARWLGKLQEFNISKGRATKCRCTFQTTLQAVWERRKEHPPNFHCIKRGLGQYPRTRGLARDVRTSGMRSSYLYCSLFKEANRKPLTEVEKAQSLEICRLLQLWYTLS